MTLYYQPDQSVLARIRARETAAAYRQNVTPAPTFAERLETLHTAYPNLEPGLMVALAQSDADLTSEAVQAIADLDTEQKRRDGFFDSVGGVLGQAKKLAAPLGPIGRGLDTAMGEFDEGMAPALKGLVRTGFVALETPLQELQTFVRRAGWSGVKLAEDQGDTSIMNRLRNIADPTRWDDQVRSFMDAPESGSSTGREALSALASGQDVDLGTGWLPSQEAEDVVRAKANVPTLKIRDVQFGGPGNPSISPGRTIAATVSEPGERQFNILSGLVDAGVAWFGDPASAVLGAAKVGEVGGRLGRAQRALRDSGSLVRAGEELATKPTFATVVDRSLQSRAAEGLGDIVDS